MSLRIFHLLFILLAIVGADFFGVWSIWYYTRTEDVLTLSLGIFSILGSLGLIWYAIKVVKHLDRLQIH
jgi:uncharacterized membrane protein YqjE